MKKIYVALIIVSVLIIIFVVGFLIYKFMNVENEDWLYSSGEVVEDMIFADVSREYWASEYILYLSQRDIMSASVDGNFYPDNKVTYIELAEILLRASMGRLDFESLSGDDFLRILEENKIFATNEVTKEKFNMNVTKCDVAVLLAKADMKIRNREQEIISLNYKDLTGIDEVSQTLIVHSVSRGFLRESGKNNFYPNKELSRAEIAEIIYLFLIQ